MALLMAFIQISKIVKKKFFLIVWFIRLEIPEKVLYTFQNIWKNIGFRTKNNSTYNSEFDIFDIFDVELEFGDEKLKITTENY